MQDHLKIKEKSNSSNFMTTSERCFYTKLNQLMERITPLYVDEHFIQRVIPTSIRYPNKQEISCAIKHIDFYLHSRKSQQQLHQPNLFKQKTKTRLTAASPAPCVRENELKELKLTH